MPVYTEFRNVTFELNYAAPDNTLPIDAIFAVSTSIREQEKIYAYNPTELVDISSVRTVLTGRHPYQVHVFNLTRTVATGTYEYEYVETVPRIEDIS